MRSWRETIKEIGRDLETVFASPKVTVSLFLWETERNNEKQCSLFAGLDSNWLLTAALNRLYPRSETKVDRRLTSAFLKFTVQEINVAILCVSIFLYSRNLAE